jgi:hypothetical protein
MQEHMQRVFKSNNGVELERVNNGLTNTMSSPGDRPKTDHLYAGQVEACSKALMAAGTERG